MFGSAESSAIERSWAGPSELLIGKIFNDPRGASIPPGKMHLNLCCGERDKSNYVDSLGG